ncbi:MAG: DUF1294 domain-containing protein [Eubacterium sp.]
MYKYILIYFISVNFFGILINLADKNRAKHNKWRIRESTLWLIGIIGGASGTYITMKTIRHKTKHKSFMIGMPMLMVIQTALIILLYFYI